MTELDRNRTYEVFRIIFERNHLDVLLEFEEESKSFFQILDLYMIENNSDEF